MWRTDRQKQDLAVHDIELSRIRELVSERLRGGRPTLESVAVQLRVSPRTLQQRLADQHLSHSQLVKQVRLTKACHLLPRKHIQIADVARQTGFASASTFSRAFQSWTGTSPRAFRLGLFVTRF